VNVGQLIARLNAYPADMPVVMGMCDEPMGHYEVLQVGLARMARDTVFDNPVVYHEGELSYMKGNDRYEPLCDVVMLYSEKPYVPSIEGELALKEIEA
jgi:hypothetical protein